MLTSLFPWVLYVLAWIFTILAVNEGTQLWPALLFFVVIFNGGIQGLWGALGHLGFPKQTAKKIGWVGNGFQTEIGYANLSIGVTGIITFFNTMWAIPVAAIMVIFFGGCAYNHIKDRIKHKNKAPCNSGPMLYSTIITTLTLLVSLIMLRI